MVRFVQDPEKSRAADAGLDDLLGDDELPVDEPSTQLRKQISLFIPISQWKLIRRVAARRGVPITRLVSDTLRPHLASWANELDL